MSKSFVNTALDTTKEKMSDHFNSLLGERPAGSKWGGEMTEEILRDLRWEETFPAQEVCFGTARYYYAVIDKVFPAAVDAAAPLKDIPTDVIRVQEGAHGKELVADGIDPVPTMIATLIVGEHQGSWVVFTAHPGHPLAPLPKDFDGDLSSLSPWTAVKLG